jgi:DNA primase
MTGNYGNVQGDPPLSGEPKRHEAGRQRAPFPRRSGTSQLRSPISAIKDRLTPSHIEALCRSWLPSGKRQGGWWLSCSPWREDRNASLGVSLSTGQWKDFATGERGDMIDLSMKLFGDSLAETIDGFADMLGIKNA